MPATVIKGQRRQSIISLNFSSNPAVHTADWLDFTIFSIGLQGRTLQGYNLHTLLLSQRLLITLCLNLVFKRSHFVKALEVAIINSHFLVNKYCPCFTRKYILLSISLVPVFFLHCSFWGNLRKAICCYGWAWDLMFMFLLWEMKWEVPYWTKAVSLQRVGQTISLRWTKLRDAPISDQLKSRSKYFITNLNLMLCVQNDLYPYNRFLQSSRELYLKQTLISCLCTSTVLGVWWTVISFIIIPVKTLPADTITHWHFCLKSSI